MKLTRHYIEQKIYAVYTVYPAILYAFDSNRPTQNDWSMTFLYGDPKRKRVQSKHFTLYANCVSLYVCVCVWLTENDKLIQSVPRLSIFITPHILFLCSFSCTAPFRGSALYRLEQKVHSCELHFHLYRIFIASRPSEILFTLHIHTCLPYRTSPGVHWLVWGFRSIVLLVLLWQFLAHCQATTDGEQQTRFLFLPIPQLQRQPGEEWKNLARSTANKKLK